MPVGRKRKSKNNLAREGVSLFHQDRPVLVNTGPLLAPDDPREYNEIVLVGEAACDWLTLTTFSREEWAGMYSYTVAVDQQQGKATRATRRMQYEGQAGDGFFIGEGRQEGAPHWMMQASGARAHEVLRHALEFHAGRDDVRCTRIDLQCTSEISPAGDLPAVAEALRACPPEEWAQRGSRPRITYFSSESGADTMYIGARKSPRFWRFYNKPIDGLMFLRVELEAKGWLGQLIWQELCDRGLFHVKQLLADELDALPVHAREVAQVCNLRFPLSGRLPRPKANRDALLATRGWLLNTVLPALERHMGTPGSGEVRQKFLEILGFDG